MKWDLCFAIYRFLLNNFSMGHMNWINVPFFNSSLPGDTSDSGILVYYMIHIDANVNITEQTFF